jgi:two-component sensor histidine kinase
VIEDLIELSRVVTGKLRLKTEVVDVRAVVRAALEVVNPAMSAKAVRLSVTVPGTPTLVSGDAERLQQVVWNLFSNAIKFTPSGGTVTVELKESGSEYVLTVEDTGIGISAEFLPFVFDRFRQADGTMTREHGGLGLGLAIVKDLTELHGGSVSATSPGKGGGARFSVRLPRLVGADRLLRSSERESVEGLPAEGALAGVRVLAVDAIRCPEVITEALTSLGANVHVADSGTEAISMWSRNVLTCSFAISRCRESTGLRS